MQAAGKRYIGYNSKSDVFRIWCFSDIHRNSKACALNKAKRDIESVRNDTHAFWIGCALFEKNEIHLNKKLCEAMQCKTLVHEIIEVVNNELQIGLTHDQIVLLEAGLYQIIARNCQDSPVKKKK